MPCHRHDIENHNHQIDLHSHDIHAHKHQSPVRDPGICGSRHEAPSSRGESSCPISGFINSHMASGMAVGMRGTGNGKNHPNKGFLMWHDSKPGGAGKTFSGGAGKTGEHKGRTHFYGGTACKTHSHNNMPPYIAVLYLIKIPTNLNLLELVVIF